jgi:predicted Zn-dependent peptidase
MPVDLPLDDPTSDLVLTEGPALVRRSVLPGGVRVLTEHDPTYRSVSLGLWQAVGSADESPRHAGSTHFLEHLLFKGTRRRTALDIADAFDRVGGESNAFTGKEQTCYWGRVRGTDLPLALDVLTDMLTDPVLDRAAFDTERTVILEELAAASDDPADIGHETLVRRVLGDTPLGLPVGGTPEAIRAVTRDDVLEHYLATYVPSRLVVTAAGDVDHDDLCARLLDALGASRWDLDPSARPGPRRPGTGAAESSRDAPSAPAVTGTQRIERAVDQSHVLLGTPGPTATSSRRHAMTYLSTALGGGASSRLFQTVREERGLAYSVYSFASGWSAGGVFGSYAACRPEVAGEVLALVRGELEDVAANGLRDDELERVRGQLAGSVVLGLEDTSSRMSRLGSAELVLGEWCGVDDTLDRLAAVEPEEIRALAADLARQATTTVLVGPPGGGTVDA